MEKKLGKAVVTVTDSKLGKEETHEEEVTTCASEGMMCNVGVTLSKTINTGNYENVKVQVALHTPSPITEIDPVFNFTYDWVANRLGEVCDDVAKQIGG